MDHNHGKLDYNEIIDGIYIGTNQCCQGHFDEQLLSKEITTDISLEEDRIDAPYGVHYYAWIPVKDHGAPSMDQLRFGVEALKEIVAQGRKVYVHCKNGHGRAPTLVAAYLVSKGSNPEEAVRIIKERRPATHLEDLQKRALGEFAAGKTS